MGLRRLELSLGSSISRLWIGSGLPVDPVGSATVNWEQVDTATWDWWQLPWGDNLALGVNWNAIGTTGWDGWALTWGT